MDSTALSITLPLVVAAGVFVLTNLVAYIRARNWNGVASTLLPWGIAVLVLWVAGQTRWAEGASFDGVLLKSVSLADLIVLGLLVSGVAGTGHKVLQAIDSTRTSAVPPLLPSTAIDVPSTVASTTAHQGDSAPPETVPTMSLPVAAAPADENPTAPATPAA